MVDEIEARIKKIPGIAARSAWDIYAASEAIQSIVLRELKRRGAVLKTFEFSASESVLTKENNDVEK